MELKLPVQFPVRIAGIVATPWLGPGERTAFTVTFENISAKRTLRIVSALFAGVSRRLRRCLLLRVGREEAVQCGLIPDCLMLPCAAYGSRHAATGLVEVHLRTDPRLIIETSPEDKSYFLNSECESLPPRICLGVVPS